MMTIKERYDEVIKLVYDLTKEHCKKEPIEGMDTIAVLDNVVDYIHEQVSKDIFENYERNSNKISI